MGKRGGKARAEKMAPERRTGNPLALKTLATLSSAPGSWYLRFVETERLADLANQIRIQVLVRTCQRQLCGPPLAVDRQMSLTLAAPVSPSIEMAPALCQPFSERVDFH